jgi:hypothetical protein
MNTYAFGMSKHRKSGKSDNSSHFTGKSKSNSKRSINQLESKEKTKEALI